MSKPKKSKPKEPLSYEKLRAVWYKKLKDEGFEDIEQDDDQLKAWSSRFVHPQSQDVFHAKEAYYRLATHFLTDYQFANPTERTVWEYHSEAVGVRDTAKLMNKHRRTKKINKDFVWAIVVRLKKAMRAMYLPTVQESNDPN